MEGKQGGSSSPFAALEVLGASADIAIGALEDEPISEEQMLDCSQSLLSLCDDISPEKPQNSDSTTPVIKKEDQKAVEETKVDQQNALPTARKLDRRATCCTCNNIVRYDEAAKFYDPPITVPLPRDRFFRLDWCPNCQPEGEEMIHITFLPRQWHEIAEIALFNLHTISPDKQTFHFRDDLCPYVVKNWENLCIGKKMNTNWSATLVEAMHMKNDVFGYKKLPTGNLWYVASCREVVALTNRFLRQMVSEDELVEPVDSSTKSKKRKRPLSKERPAKKQARSKETGIEEAAVNPILFDPYAAYFPAPPRFYTPTEKIPLAMRIIPENSAPQIEIRNNGLTCNNSSGYRMARASYPIIEPGVYYYEVVLPRKMQGNVRLGWSTNKGDLQGPVGYDLHSFSYRNKTGQKFWRARGKPYGEPYGEGDTVGCLIKTTNEYEERLLEQDLPKTRKKKNEKWAKHEPIYSKKTEESLTQEVMVGSEIMFFVNGICQGLAFADIIKGEYYPAISLFMKAQCTCNFGPTFSYPVSSDHKYHKGLLPVCAVVPSEHPKPKVELVPIVHAEMKPITNEQNDENAPESSNKTSVSHVLNPIPTEPQKEGTNETKDPEPKKSFKIEDILTPNTQ